MEFHLILFWFFINIYDLQASSSFSPDIGKIEATGRNRFKVYCQNGKSFSNIPLRKLNQTNLCSLKKKETSKNEILSLRNIDSNVDCPLGRIVFDGKKLLMWYVPSLLVDGNSPIQSCGDSFSFLVKKGWQIGIKKAVVGVRSTIPDRGMDFESDLELIGGKGTSFKKKLSSGVKSPHEEISIEFSEEIKSKCSLNDQEFIFEFSNHISLEEPLEKDSKYEASIVFSQIPEFIIHKCRGI